MSLPFLVDGKAKMPSVPDAMSLALESVLRAERCYESDDGIVRRREALKNLNVLVKQWIQVGFSRLSHLPLSHSFIHSRA